MDKPEAVLAGRAGEGDDWPAQFLSDADHLDLGRLTDWFAEDIEVRFANAPPIRGRAAVRDAFADFWGTLSGMRHVRETLVREGETATQQSVVTYALRDGREVSMPVASHLRRAADGRLDRLWIYIDMAPLHAGPGKENSHA